MTVCELIENLRRFPQDGIVTWDELDIRVSVRDPKRPNFIRQFSVDDPDIENILKRMYTNETK